MNFPDWLEKVNPLVWLTITATILISISTIYSDKYMLLWLGTFIYGIVGFAINISKGESIKKAIEGILLLAYTTFFVWGSYHIIFVVS